MIELTSLRHAYPEPKDFQIDRKNGHADYTLIHFFNSVDILYEGRLVQTQPHAVIIYDIGTPQHFKSNVPLTHDWIHFRGDINELLIDTNLELDTLYYPNQTTFITDLTYELEYEFYGKPQNSEKLAQLMFSELLIKLGRSISEKTTYNVSLETKHVFRHLRQEVFANLDQEWTLSRMAKKIGYSESHFSAVYKAIYGTSPTADIINARINSATNMLAYGNNKIERIADSLGYLNTTHFIRQFKDKIGVSPSAYRKQHNTTLMK